MSPIDFIDDLHKVGAVITNSHVVYTSGKHGSAYVNKDAIYPHTELTSRLCQTIAEHFQSHRIEVVLAPAVGGIILSQWTAFHLSQLCHHEVMGVYAEKDPSGESFLLKRGYDILTKGKRVLIVEDILTTGGSVKKVVDLARSLPCEVVGVAALCNRGGITAADIGAPPELFALTQVSLEAWDVNQCPLCQRQVPINTTVGKGLDFLKNR